MRSCITAAELKQTKVVGQVEGKFVLCKCRDLMYVVDQHAADERILYELLCKKHTTTRMEARHTFSVPSKQNNVIFLISLLHECGWDVLLEARGLSLRSSPWFPTIDMAVSILYQYLSCETDKSERSLTKLSAAALKTYSCRRAIMFGDILTLAESRLLIQRLSLCSNPFICCHGRPSVHVVCLIGRR